MIPQTHQGEWRGPNRLWLHGPDPERSDGQLVAGGRQLSYTWEFQGEAQTGTLSCAGPLGSLEARFQDSFHAQDGMTLHGAVQGARLRLFGTYPAGDGPPWGWRIELDWADPEHLTLRMFNLPPSDPEAIAVDLRGARVSG